MRLIIKILLQFIIFINLSAKDIHIIGCREGAGFFANFFVVLAHLYWCKEHNKWPVVYWDKSSLYYSPEGHNGIKTNVWQYYFEPYKNLAFDPNRRIYNSHKAPDGFLFPLNQLKSIKLRDVANKLIKKYIKIKPEIEKKIDDFYKKNFLNKKTVGIHLRGTDKFNEVEQVRPEDIIEFATRYKDYQFFIATDEKKILELCKQKLSNVIFYESTRADDNQAIHLNGTIKNKALLGEEVLIECLLLSKCDILLHTFSCVSIAAHFFNPKIDAILFRAGELPKFIRGEL